MIVDATLKAFAPEGSTVATKIAVDGKNAASVTMHFDHVDREAYVNNYILGA